jgi:death-on-curing protein
MTQKSIVRISVETVIAIHVELINKIGGLHGIRDENLLDMSINSPFQTFGGNDLYPTLINKAAHLIFSLIKNHPFLDGNKRIGVTVMIVFLKSNGLEINCTNEELAELGLGLADGSFDEDYAQKWIKTHII